MMIFMLAWALGANDLAGAVAAQLHAAPVVRGTFTQEQHLAGFKKTLHASGRYVLVQQRGILWDTEAPVVTRLTITRDRIMGRRADGSVLVNLGQEQAPIRAINSILLALLGGDVQALKQGFHIAGSAEPPWKLTLVPQDDAIAHAIAQVVLQGDSRVQHIEVREANGDQRGIQLHETGTDALTPAEEQRFE